MTRPTYPDWTKSAMKLINGGEKQPDPHALEFIKYRVIGKPYSKWRAIITEATGESDTLFRMGLYQAHNIRIEGTGDPMLYIIQDTNQMRELAEQGIHNPTSLQLLLSTKIISLSEQDAIDRMVKWVEAQKV
jgi:hypothetical protein